MCMFVYMFILAAYASLVFMYGGDSGDGNTSTSTTEEASYINPRIIGTNLCYHMCTMQLKPSFG